MNKQDAQICSWLEESDLEETGAQCFDESMSESDRDSENLEHNSDTEQSGDEMMSSETCFHRLNLVDHRPSTSFNQLTTIPRSRSRSPVTFRRPSRSARQHRERLSFRSSSTSSNSSSDEPLTHIRVRPIRTFQTERNFIEPTTNRPLRVPVYKANTKTVLLRRMYLKEISLALVRPHLMKRSSIMTFPSTLKRQIARFVPMENQETHEKREGICSICPTRKNRRTKKGYKVCAKLLCNEHCVYLCECCFDGEYGQDA
ncbi:unnamed protein product [Parnassius apollo]|uniref:(apollo) hypothetical protein n=1 Tax=Parnassius apollo TaxID=110799 RepID=A0A8S3WLF8_PARAO|nr:unnamed protein product [Parnassius apollo]